MLRKVLIIHIWPVILYSMSRKLKGEKSKHKIIETAIQQFSLKGYSNTSAQEIADICGISQATIFYHFKNKKKLFEEVLAYIIANNRSIFAQVEIADDDDYEVFIQLLNSNIRWCYHFPEQTQILLLLFYFSSTDSEFKALATSTIDKGRRLVYEQLEKLSVRNIIQPTLSLDKLSEIIQQHINSVMFQMLARDDRDSIFVNFDRDIRSFLNILLHN